MKGQKKRKWETNDQKKHWRRNKIGGKGKPYIASTQPQCSLPRHWWGQDLPNKKDTKGKNTLHTVKRESLKCKNALQWDHIWLILWLSFYVANSMWFTLHTHICNPAQTEAERGWMLISGSLPSLSRAGQVECVRAERGATLV